jgi:hypothetical protein
VSPNPVPVLAVVSRHDHRRERRPRSTCTARVLPTPLPCGWTVRRRHAAGGCHHAPHAADDIGDGTRRSGGSRLTPAPGGGSRTPPLTIADVPARHHHTRSRQIRLVGRSVHPHDHRNDLAASTVEGWRARRTGGHVVARHDRSADVRVARIVPVTATPAPGGGRATMNFAVNAIPVASVTVSRRGGRFRLGATTDCRSRRRAGSARA